LQSKLHGLKIFQLGSLAHGDVLNLYSDTQALIFPSLSESFGLPLLEAKERGCAILGSELDFVRDVCEPQQCFDPLSSVSIARAVRRFMLIPEKPIEPKDAASFIRALGF
jgi:glycosyltransferase involved in cell wall biosynthesis